MKISLSIGINYKNTPFQLAGCENDARAWAKALKGLGFRAELLLGEDATSSAIRVAMMDRVAAAQKEPTVVVISFAGHGSWVCDTSGDEPDGQDETLCAADLSEDGARGQIVDDDIGKILCCLPPSSHLVFITDSCHSGTVFRFAPGAAGARKIRGIPPAQFRRSARALRRIERAFGANGPIASVVPPLPNVLHLAACRDSEFACEAEIRGRPSGAFTSVALPALAAAAKARQTYGDAWRVIRSRLPNSEFPQTPQINGTTKLRNQPVFGG